MTTIVYLSSGAFFEVTASRKEVLAAVRGADVITLATSPKGEAVTINARAIVAVLGDAA